MFRSSLTIVSALLIFTHPLQATDWDARAVVDAKEDYSAVAYDGQTPNKLVCDTTIRAMAV